MKTFDVIIATYNRPESVEILVNDILSCSILPEKIIIVDASEKKMEFNKMDHRIKYIHSSHANQPYQRYVGYLASESEYLLYFDDDMRIFEAACFSKLFAEFTDKIAAIQPAIVYPHTFFSQELPRSKGTKNKIIDKIKVFTGVPNLKEGEYWLCGLKGSKPNKKVPIKWFNGPVFMVKRHLMYRNFNFNLLNLYEQKLGKGEDGISGFTYSQEGVILYFPEVMFSHDPSYESTYTPNLETFGKRYLFSRLYHSLEFVRLTNKSKIIAIIHYHWYSLWRVIGLTLNQIIDYKASRTQLLIGYLKGWKLSIQKFKMISKVEENNYWKREAEYDISK